MLSSSLNSHSDESNSSGTIIYADSERTSNEENWKTQKGRKRHKSSSTISSGAEMIEKTHTVNDLTIVIMPVDINVLITKLNFLKVHEKVKHDAVDGVIQVRQDYRLNLLVDDTSNMESIKALLAVTCIGAIRLQVYQRHSKDCAVGVIRGV